MVVAVAKAHHWNHLLVTGQVGSQNDLIREQKIDPRLFRRTLPLAWLAPDIVESILEGTQPVDLSLAKLYGAPAGWVEQRKRLGFPEL
jgi:site-specific DNA recombinase